LETLSGSHDLLSSSDYLRLTRAVDCNNLVDQGYNAWSLCILLSKIIAFDNDQYPTTSLFEIRPDPINRGLRTLIYRPEFQRWRDKHPEELKVVTDIEREKSWQAMIGYISEAVRSALSLIPK